MTTPEGIHRVVHLIEAMLLEKNKRYGDSALHPLHIFSHAPAAEQIRVRIDDKLSRIAHGNEILDDEDTILDLTGYLILLMVARGIQ